MDWRLWLGGYLWKLRHWTWIVYVCQECHFRAAVKSSQESVRSRFADVVMQHEATHRDA